MSVYTTEITSAKIHSDNPIHQRLLSAYHFAKPYIEGDLLELGCGEGRGVEILAPLAKRYQGIDKIEGIIKQLRIKYPDHDFMSGTFPPFPFKDNEFDLVIAFQVIEHVKKDEEFLREVHRMLKPRGVALITTPNIKMTLSRNPWHIREYTGRQLKELCEKYFANVEMKGIAGNEKVTKYHEQNRVSVNKIMKYDILNLQHKLPASLLSKPYEILNRINRERLKSNDNELVKSIKWDDFKLGEPDECDLDLFCVVTK
ncbi:MAG: class I SAM-dependent methyltransferase [Ekhidna sp.]|nr:class I SAM-dependent methyltransferase [Ekhidna sp.]